MPATSPPLLPPRPQPGRARTAVRARAARTSTPQLSSWPRATARTPAARVPTYTPTPRQVSASHPPLETKGPTYARTRAPYSHPHQGSLLTPTRGPYLHPQQGSLLTRLRQQARDRLREARVLGAHLGRVRVGVRVGVRVRVRVRVWVRVRVRIRVRVRVVLELGRHRRAGTSTRVSSWHSRASAAARPSSWPGYR